MIYHFKTTTKDGKKTYIKDFYLTASTDNELYRRIESQYAVSKNNVDILERIDEDSIELSPIKKIEAPVTETKPKKRGRKKKDEQDSKRTALKDIGGSDKPVRHRKQRTSNKKEN